MADNGKTEKLTDEQMALQQTLLEQNDTQLNDAIANKRAEIKEAKSDHGKTGRRVASLNEDLEVLLMECDKRRQRRLDEKQTKLTGV